MLEVGVGRVVDNKYEIIAPIGKGGMSNVWLAKDRRLEKLWAVKEIKPNVVGAQGEANRKAIIDEANFMKRLDYPAIPRVVDIIDMGATIFVVMDFIPGTALDKLFKRQNREPFAQEEVINWGIQLCNVLEYLHSMNPPIIYRDMKPANIMLNDDGSVKLIDFGIAMEYWPSRGQDLNIQGTYGYAPPEQLNPKVQTDTRADIYALGVTLYTLVTGHTPKVKRDEHGRRLNDEYGYPIIDFSMSPIRSINPRLSEGLEHIILRATQDDRDRRYQTIAEMRYDLENYEQLTEEYRSVQREKLNVFRRWVIAAGVSVVAGILCLVISNILRGSDINSYLIDAQTQSVEEINGEASPAEKSYTAAIELDPSNIEVYHRLLDNVYKADYVLTPTEAGRWSRLFKENQNDIEGNDGFAQLCYDAGVTFLCYYQGENTDGGAGSAVVNTTRAAEWFELARLACEVDADGNPQSLSAADYAATGTYATISQFYDEIQRQTREGVATTDTYHKYWEALQDAVKGFGDEVEPAVKLRLYRVAFESISSPTYMAGFARAGIGQQDAESFLTRVRDEAKKLEVEALSSEDTLLPIYQEIVDGYQDAQRNINTTYANPTLKASGASANEGGGE